MQTVNSYRNLVARMTYQSFNSLHIEPKTDPAAEGWLTWVPELCEELLRDLCPCAAI